MNAAEKRKLLRTAKFAAFYGIGARRLKEVLTSPEQKIIRKNVEKLIPAQTPIFKNRGLE